MRSKRIGKVDPVSGVLRGSFAFAQFANTKDAKTALKQAIIRQIQIDSLKVSMNLISSNVMHDAEKAVEKQAKQVPSYFLQNISEQVAWSRRNAVCYLSHFYFCHFD